jgi:RNA polymerase sigma-70 factor (ECF subfamily)
LTIAEGSSLGAGSEGLRADIVSSIPSLRAFAVSLCGNPDRADDLVHDTLLKALGGMDSFTQGTNLTAWLFTILRNAYYSDYRKRRRETADPDGALAAKLEVPASQTSHMEFLDFHEALQKLPADQREALVLIGASGLSYDEAAEICNCAPGTMKSRVNRARNRLSELLGLEHSQRVETEASAAKPKARRTVEGAAPRR